MNPRLYDRLAATVSVVLLTVLALFTIYLARAAERDRARAAPASVAPGQPDYFVDRLALLTMTSTGAPGYRIEAHRLVHFPDDDTARFESPTLISLTPDRPRLTVTADTGLLFNPTPQREQSVHLSGHVRLTRAATGQSGLLQADTDFAIVLPDRDLVQTDRAVQIRLGEHRLDGVGMELNTSTRQLRLDSRVSAVLQPPAPR